MKSMNKAIDKPGTSTGGSIILVSNSGFPPGDSSPGYYHPPLRGSEPPRADGVEVARCFNVGRQGFPLHQ